MPNRRRALRVLAAGLALVAGAGNGAAQQVRILGQSAPLAGFQYYSGKILWDEMR